MSYPTLDSQSETLHSEEELSFLDLKKVPEHVAIVMDGNRRWAAARDKPVEVGHWQGAETLDTIVQSAAEIGVRTLTVYAFSTENWNRGEEEVSHLMQIIEAYLINKRERLVMEGVKLSAIGDLAGLPCGVRKALTDTMEATASCDRINLVIALNYGGRDEIIRAMKKLGEKIEQGELSSGEISEELLGQSLDTEGRGDPSLIIRTSGEQRLSNFLLWQGCYSEIVVTDVLWPEFSPGDFISALLEYQNRKRRYGK